MRALKIVYLIMCEVNRKSEIASFVQDTSKLLSLVQLYIAFVAEGKVPANPVGMLPYILALIP